MLKHYLIDDSQSFFQYQFLNVQTIYFYKKPTIKPLYLTNKLKRIKICAELFGRLKLPKILQVKYSSAFLGGILEVYSFQYSQERSSNKQHCIISTVSLCSATA